ncbi:MAG: YaiO family outer membrane beta-barrel protein [Proteobacteria bacterium]|nr:YaiO family outer membrane beta-barrel protein [Pseudomonadota bacterium]
MAADQFVLLATCLFGRATAPQNLGIAGPATPGDAPPRPALAPADPVPLTLPAVQFALSGTDHAGGETPAATPSTTPAAATPVKPPQRPVEVYAAASATHIQYAGAATTSDWRSFTLGVVAPLRRSALTFEVSPERRSGTTDTRAMAQIDATLAPRLSGSLALSATPRAHFREQWAMAGGLDWGVGRRVGLALDARVAHYATGRFASLAPALRLSPRALPLELTARWINLWDPAGRHWQGWSLKAGYELSDRARLVGGYARYPDTDSGVTRRMTSAYAGAVVPLGQRLTLRLTASRDQREASYTATGVVLGLSWRLGPRRP